MNEQEQRIAIAAHCGWTKIEIIKPSLIKGVDPEGKLFAPIPDYLNDLNAMQEAVLMNFTPLQICNFQRELGDIAERHSVCFCECLASWWAEAFLRTAGKLKA